MRNVWRGGYVKNAESLRQETQPSSLVPSPALQAVVVLMVFCEAVVADDKCFCEFGCFKRTFQTVCCDEICTDAAARQMNDECRQNCPGFYTLLKLKRELVERDENITYWRNMTEEVRQELNALRKNASSTVLELRRVKTKLHNVERSGKLISGLATPLCLIGAMIIVHVVCLCLYQHSGFSKRQANVDADLDHPSEGNRVYGKRNCHGANIDIARVPTYVATKPSVIDSGLPQHPSDRPPVYVSGSKVGRVSLPHSRNDTGVDMPCDACAPTTTASLGLCSRTSGLYQQNITATQQRQISQPQHTHFQQFQQQHLHQFAQQQHQFYPINQTRMNDVMLLNQNDPNQPVQPAVAELGDSTEQSRRSERHAPTQNEEESCAFRLAQLDFSPDRQQSRHLPRRPESNYVASADSNGFPEENQTNSFT